MGLGDKISNKAQEVTGKAKEALGDATNNEKLRQVQAGRRKRQGRR